MRMLMPLILVGTGGMIGSLCRYGLTVLTEPRCAGFPLGTLLSNVAGCLIIGAVVELAGSRGVLSPEARLFFATGFCGGFTTLSSMIYELTRFLDNREYMTASAYFALTMGGAFGAFLGGVFLARLIARTLWGVAS